MELERLLRCRDSESADRKSDRLSVQGSWPESDKSRECEGSVLALRSFLPYHSVTAVFVRQLRGPHLST